MGHEKPVIAYLRLNDVTVPDRFPLPVLTDLLPSIGKNNKIFRRLDLLQGFWQVNMAGESKPLTAFSIPQGHYQFPKMPFGLRNSLITFARLMNIVFQCLLGSTLTVYLHIMIVMSEDMDQPFEKLLLVYERLEQACLKIKLFKCRKAAHVSRSCCQ